MDIVNKLIKAGANFYFSDDENIKYSLFSYLNDAQIHEIKIQFKGFDNLENYLLAIKTSEYNI